LPKRHDFWLFIWEVIGWNFGRDTHSFASAYPLFSLVLAGEFRCSTLKQVANDSSHMLCNELDLFSKYGEVSILRVLIVRGFVRCEPVRPVQRDFCTRCKSKMKCISLCALESLSSTNSFSLQPRNNPNFNGILAFRIFCVLN